MAIQLLLPALARLGSLGARGLRGAVATGGSGGEVVVTVADNATAVAKSIGGLADGNRRAIARALNRAIERTATRMARSISGKYSIGVRDVRARLKIRKALASGKGRLEVVLEPTGQTSVNVVRYKRGAVRKADQGVGVTIKRTGGRKQIRGSFVANNGRTVFIREGKGKLPIRPVQSITVPAMFGERDINADAVAFAVKEFEREYARLMELEFQKVAQAAARGPMQKSTMVIRL